MMVNKSDLIDAIDLLAEANDLNEAAFMAISAITNKAHRNAMERLIGTIGDRITSVDGLLNGLLPDTGAK